MLSATDPNRPLSIFRRFLEGWFSVYLSIFLITLAVRFLFFGAEVPRNPPTALSDLKLKAHYPIRYILRRADFLPKATVNGENRFSFGSGNEQPSE